MFGNPEGTAADQSLIAHGSRIEGNVLLKNRRIRIDGDVMGDIRQPRTAHASGDFRKPEWRVLIHVTM